MEKLLVLEQLEQAERHLLEAHVRVDQLVTNPLYSASKAPPKRLGEDLDT